MVTAPGTPELSRMIKTKGLPAEAIKIDADAGERAALARRFGLPGVDSLRAEIMVEQRGKAIRAVGTLRAAIRQSCAISAEDFPATIEEAIDLRFVPEDAVPSSQSETGEIEVELDAQDCDEIEFSGEAFNLGEAVSQTLGLAIDPYAEGPNADNVRAKTGIVGEGEQDGPMAAALAALKKG